MWVEIAAMCYAHMQQTYRPLTDAEKHRMEDEAWFRERLRLNAIDHGRGWKLAAWWFGGIAFSLLGIARLAGWL